jgi:hypothetical protein
MAEKWAFFTRNKAKLCLNLIVTLVFEKNSHFFRNLSKIAGNRDENSYNASGFLG